MKRRKGGERALIAVSFDARVVSMEDWRRDAYAFR